MSDEVKINQAVNEMFSFTKQLVYKNIVDATIKGKITIDKDKLPGLQKLIDQTIDDARMRSAKILNDVLKRMKVNSLAKENDKR